MSLMHGMCMTIEPRQSKTDNPVSLCMSSCVYVLVFSCNRLKCRDLV